MNKYKVTRKCGDIEYVTTVGAISKMSAIDKIRKQDAYDYPCMRWALIDCEEVKQWLRNFVESGFDMKVLEGWCK